MIETNMRALLGARIEGLHQDWASGCAHPVRGWLEAMRDKVRTIETGLDVLIGHSESEPEPFHPPDEDEDLL